MTFRYTSIVGCPHTKSSQSLRLLELLPGLQDSTIETRLLNATLAGHPQPEVHCRPDSGTNCIVREDGYMALSYEWGDTSRHATILVDGQTFTIRHHLWKFLVQIRHRWMHRLPMLFWIDSICINQAYTEEKTQQIRLMHKIYAHANEVVVWLGDATDESNVVFRDLQKYCDKVETERADRLRSLSSKQAMHTRFGYVLPIVDNTERHFKQHQISPREVFDFDAPLKSAALLKLCRRTYWTRAWIVLECLSAKQVTPFCGSRYLSHAAFLLLGNLCKQLKDDLSLAYMSDELNSFPDEQNAIPSLQTPFDPATRVAEMTSRWYIDRHEGLESLLRSYHGSGCSDLHDKVYAFLGLSSEGDEFPIDYGVPLFTLLARTIAFCSASKAKRKINAIDPIKPTCDSIHVAQLLAKDLDLIGKFHIRSKDHWSIPTLPDDLLDEKVTIELDYLGVITDFLRSSDKARSVTISDQSTFKINAQTYRVVSSEEVVHRDRAFALRGTPFVLIYRRTLMNLYFIGLATICISNHIDVNSTIVADSRSQFKAHSTAFTNTFTDTDTISTFIGILYFPKPSPIPRYRLLYSRRLIFRSFRWLILPLLPDWLRKLIILQSADSDFIASPFLRVPLMDLLTIIEVFPDRTREYEDYCQDLMWERLNQRSLFKRFCQSAIDVLVRAKNTIVPLFSQKLKTR